MLDIEKDPGDNMDSRREESGAGVLVQDIIEGIIESGTLPFPSSVFVDEGFRWFEPKKKERILGDCPLWFPKGCYIGIFTDEKYQFCSKSSLLEFLEGLGPCDPYEVIELVKEKFNDCPIGIAGADEAYLVFWSSEKERTYYLNGIVEIEPKVIIV